MLCDSRRATFADCCVRGRMVGIVQFKWNYPAEARTPLQYRHSSPPQQECPSRQTNGRCVRRPSLFCGCPYKSVGILITPPRAPLLHAYVCQGCSPRPMLPSLRSSPAACVHLRTMPLRPAHAPTNPNPRPAHRILCGPDPAASPCAAHDSRAQRSCFEFLTVAYVARIHVTLCQALRERLLSDTAVATLHPIRKQTTSDERPVGWIY